MNKKYQVEVVWNREFDFVKFGDSNSVFEDAIKAARGAENMGHGACVKKARVVDENGDVVWAYGKIIKPN